MNEKFEPVNRQDERELVHRLDKRLLLFAMFGNLVKSLDNSNLGKLQILNDCLAVHTHHVIYSECIYQWYGRRVKCTRSGI